MIKRIKRRYLALNIESQQPFNEQEAMNAIESSILKLFGEYGASKADIRLIKTNPEKNQLTIRCSHLMLEKVRAAIALTTEVAGKPAAIHVINVSGTLKSLAKKTTKNE
jgi:ribonuclease P/MRP protein subunit POP5